MSQVSRLKVEWINNMVRNHFALGVKTSNKVYFPEENTTPLLKKLVRHSLRSLSHKQQLRPESRSLSAVQLLGQASSLRAGNCAEYTRLAIYHGLALSFPTWGFIAACRFTGFDHAFCVFGLSENYDVESIPALWEMSHSPHGTAIVCDSWMNIVCMYQEYPTRLLEKANSYLAQGKGIVTNQGSINAEGWAQRILHASVRCLPSDSILLDIYG